MYEALVTKTQKRTGKISKDDFALIQVIGTGAYGKVLLVKRKGTDRHYAMKIIKKRHIRQKM
jgi:serine/threonine protein kinase